MTRLVPLLLLAYLAVPASLSAQTVSGVAAGGRCSTAGVEGLSAQLAETQRCMNPGAFVRFAPHPGITLSSSRVHPYMQASARDALHRAARSRSITVNSAFRTLADQYVLYHSGGCGLAARPGRSNHQSGRAVDVASYASVKSALQAQGCRWLGSRDRVHFDCPGSDRRSDAIRAFQRLWNINNPSDRISEDGDYGPATARRLGRAPAGGFSRSACDAMPEPMPMPMPEPMPMPGSAQLLGVVYTGGSTSNRLTGATVRIVETGASQPVNASGAWSFNVPAGEYTVEATKDGYGVGRHTCIVATGDVWCSVELTESVGTTDGVLRGVLYETNGAGSTEMRIAGQVVVTETGMRVTASSSGSWNLSLSPGTYTVVASGSGYASVTRSCTVVAGEDAWCSIGLTPEMDTSTLRGVVFVQGDVYQRINGATVRIIETDGATTSREGDGMFSFSLRPGTYTVEAGGPGFATTRRTCTLGTDVTWCSVGLARAGSGGGLEVEEAGNDHGAESDAPPEDLSAASSAGIQQESCTVGVVGHGSSAPWVPLLLSLLGLSYWRRSR